MKAEFDIFRLQSIYNSGEKSEKTAAKTVKAKENCMFMFIYLDPHLLWY